MHKCVAICIALAIFLDAGLGSKPTVAACFEPSQEATAAEAAYERGKALFESESYEDAIRQFTQAIRSPQKRVLAYANRGRAYLRCHRLDEASADLRQGLALANRGIRDRGSLAFLHEQRAWVYIVLHELACEEADSASTVGVRKVGTQDNLKRALADLTIATKLERNRLKSWQLMLWTASQLRNWATVISACDKVLDIVGIDYHVQQLRAEARLQMGNWKEAITDCTKLLEDAQPTAELYILRARAHSSGGDFDQAFADYERALELRPQCALAYVEKAELHFACDNTESALLNVERAVKIDASALAGTNTLRDFFGATADGTGNQVMPILDRICEVAPGQPACYLMRARAHLADGDIEAARKDYRKAVKIGIRTEEQTFARIVESRLECESGDQGGSEPDQQ